MTTSLHDYCHRGKLEKIIEKVGKGRNLNRQEPSYGTVVHIAAACGHVNIVRWCVAQKAELNVTEVHGWTALHLAALKGHFDCAKVLLDAGVDRTVKDLTGKTAAELAQAPPDWVPSESSAVEGRQKIVELLK